MKRKSKRIEREFDKIKYDAIDEFTFHLTKEERVLAAEMADLLVSQAICGMNMLTHFVDNFPDAAKIMEAACAINLATHQRRVAWSNKQAEKT